MNISKFERLSAKLVFAAAVIGLTLFAGAKHGSPTNDPPPAAAPRVQIQSPTPRVESLPLLSSTSTSHFDSITNWHARGAWIDWQRLSFPDGFRFPIGTNFIHEVTLMSYGEIRECLRGPVIASFNQLPATGYQPPTLLSLQPGVSSVAYGLTPSNTLVFAWENACVNRDPTNRIDASIELFASGAIAMRTSSDVQPPTFNLQPPVLPPGYCGEGQDDAWVTNALPDDAEAIAVKGYARWLSEDYVGVDEENGRYQAAVTIAALPEDGSPCYLECGSYKVNVTAPGTYRFPLEVFETYEVKTLPTPVPFSIEFDDGFTGAEESFEIVEVPDTPPLLLMAAPQNQNDDSTVNLNLQPQPLHLNPYRFYLQPKVVVRPKRIPLSMAEGAHVSIWCNLCNVTRRFFRAASREFYLNFCFPSDAEIIEAEIEEMVEIILENNKGSASGCFCVYDDVGNQHIEPEEPERTDATVFDGETYHHEVTNDWLCTYLTAVTERGTTAANGEMITVLLPDIPSADVCVYMATTESGRDEYNDAVGWTVTVNGTVALQGQASVSGHVGGAGAATYGITSGAVLLASGHYTKPEDDMLRIRLQCSAQNVGDGLKETCVQILVVPTE